MSAWILGHKNPDSDSIISALACADLYRRRGLDVQARAQGKPAPETQFILERFGLEAPEVIDSVAGQDLYLVDLEAIDLETLNQNSAILLQPKPKPKKVIEPFKFEKSSEEEDIPTPLPPKKTSTEKKFKFHFSPKLIDTDILLSSICRTAIEKSESVSDASEKYGILGAIGTKSGEQSYLAFTVGT